jgi:hypothetical protein
MRDMATYQNYHKYPSVAYSGKQGAAAWGDGCAKANKDDSDPSPL